MPSVEAVRQLLERVLSGELSHDEVRELVEALAPEPVDPMVVLSLHARYSERASLAPGELVRWKPGLRNKRLPQYGDPAIVIDVLAEPVVDNQYAADTPYFRERLDVVLGVVDEDEDFVAFHFDSARFEAFDGEG